MKLIADSGSTKTVWYVLPLGLVVHTAGINPVRDDEDVMRRVVRSARAAIETEGLSGRVSSSVGSLELGCVHFYGAGCLPAFTEPLARVLRGEFPAAKVIEIESDLLGAARALCGRREGIACILGTGSNSCHYDGRRIVANVSPMGWILGDEGSGAVLGRTLLSELYKGDLRHMRREFEGAFLPSVAQFDTDARTFLIGAVYRGSQPNRFLASLVPFISAHRGDAAVASMLSDAFRSFLRRNVVPYGRPDLPVNCVGGIAGEFAEELHTAASMEGMSIGRIEPSPIDGMVLFHRDN